MIVSPNRIRRGLSSSSSTENFLLGIEMQNKDIHYVKIAPSILESLDDRYQYLTKMNNAEGEVLVLNNSFFSNSLRIPNVYRYIIKSDGTQISIYEFAMFESIISTSNYSDFNLDTDNHLKSIIIILESPHIDEYNYNAQKIIRKGPAQGKTGSNIKDYLMNVFTAENGLITRIEENEEYRVILINPIPFQTSLHYFHRNPIKTEFRTLRNRVWRVLWRKEPKYKRGLIRAINKCNDGSIILNCCTKDLSAFVSNELNSKKIEHICLNHPSSWHRGVKVRSSC